MQTMTNFKFRYLSRLRVLTGGFYIDLGYLTKVLPKRKGEVYKAKAITDEVDVAHW